MSYELQERYNKERDFWENNITVSYGSANLHRNRRKQTSWSEGQVDIYNIQQRVIRAYRNEVVNGQPLTLNK